MTDEAFLNDISAKDQLAASINTMASLMAAYREALRKEGFSQKEAWQLLVEYQRVMMTGFRS